MKKWLYLIASCVILSGITVGIVQFIESTKDKVSVNNKEVNKKEVVVEPTFEEKLQQEKPIADVNTMELSIKSEKALLINLSTDEIIFAKSAEERAFPASLTKVMTVLVGIEEIKDLQTKVTVPPTIFDYIAQANASVAGFNPNEIVTAGDLLHGIMLPSGADASLAIALHVANSEKEYVQLMNAKAKELGMNDTHFENVEGLHHNNHYTTAHDQMKLLKYALRNEEFKKIFMAQKYKVTSTNYRPEGFVFSSTLFSKLDMQKERSFTLLGGKTGYTTEGGLSLISMAEKNGMDYALVVMNAPGTNRTKQFNITDTLKIYEAIE